MIESSTVPPQRHSVAASPGVRFPLGGARRCSQPLSSGLLIALLMLALPGWTPAWAGAAGRGATVSPAPMWDQKVITVPIDKSRIVDLRYPIARVSVANPAICDILVVNPKQIYLVGKQLGTTNMTLWSDKEQVKDMIGLEVTHDIQTLKQKLYEMLPGEDIRVKSSQGALVLSGEVSSAPRMAAALQIAEQFAPQAESQARVGLPGSNQKNVINLMQVGGAQQVLLEVKVAEISRQFSKTLDIGFDGIYKGGEVRIGTVNGGGGVIVPPVALDSALGVAATASTIGSVNLINDAGAFANATAGNFFFNVVLDIAQDEGLAKILAEPNLTTLSGQDAHFISGGSFPVSSINQNGNVETVYQDYGIQLDFVPTVLDSGLINLDVSVTVSDVDKENSTNYGLGLRQRGANSTVEIPSGKTLAIAGLLSENLTDGVTKFPGLGDVPVLGALFRSQTYLKNQTELMIFVTPRLARPFNSDLIKLPTEGFVEPSNTEFYLMGQMEGARRSGASSRTQTERLGPDKTGAEGLFGHDL